MTDIDAARARMGDVLAELDALAERGSANEALEDLNAELEDILILLSGIRTDDADGQEEWTDAMEDVRALAEDYRALAEDVPGVEALAQKLENIVAAAAEG